MMHKMMVGPQRKNWLEIKLEIPQACAEIVSAFLFSQGSTGLIQEKISKGRERFIAYFPEERSIKKRLTEICSYLTNLCGSAYSNLEKRIITEEKWAEAWKSNFKPVKVSPRLVVKPPWGKYHKSLREKVIQINPGMAFGTGTHQTTQMCLRFLDILIPAYFKQPKILDVGTGSGILAIAAHKLGAKKIWAIDIDPLALKAARENIKLNKIEKGIILHLASPDRIAGKFDIVVANLLPQELMAVKDNLVTKVTAQGGLIISGFLKGQKEEISTSFGQYGFQVWQAEELKGWAGFILRRIG